MSLDPLDERSYSRRAHRMTALEAMELAEVERERAEIEAAEPDWELIRYFQADAQVHALLALSAVDS